MSVIESPEFIIHLTLDRNESLYRVFYDSMEAEDQGQWIALIRFNRQLEAAARLPHRAR